MTSSQFILGWAAYLAGATGCLVSLIMITGRLPVRFRRLLCLTTAVLLYTPWWLTRGSDLLSPALLTMVYDGMTHGFETMTRAGLITAITAGSAALVAIILPVKKTGKDKKTNEQAPEPSGNRKQSKRQEPTC
ncbi:MULTISPECIES: hypothetical protein [unclassified Endozoicomonas]|uniref:hypothetical protein n=1 Tax=unclassified Endozoicomonas TaxID=2644528 RepID=UPI002148A1D4|nr:MULTISPECIES: hypothetical protein [unclassified Endozoicomonas]